MDPVQSSEAAGLLSVRETARRLIVCRRTLERLIAAGEFPRPAKIGAKSVFFPSDVEDYLAKLKAARASLA